MCVSSKHQLYLSDIGKYFTMLYHLSDTTLMFCIIYAWTKTSSFRQSMIMFALNQNLQGVNFFSNIMYNVTSNPKMMLLTKIYNFNHLIDTKMISTNYIR